MRPTGSDARLLNGAPKARIPLLGPEEMTEEQRRIYEEVIAGPRGRMIGPLRAAIHSPELALRWSRLGEFVRFSTRIPARQSELAILVTGRRWSCQVEWAVHATAAADAGLPETIIDAIRLLEVPALELREDALVYAFTTQVQQTGQVEPEIYAELHALWGDAGIVELAAVIGYYTMVAITLNAHEIPLPDGFQPALNPPAGDALAILPPAPLGPA